MVQNFELERRDKMAFEYNKLRGRIVEMFGSQAAFASAMKWSERTLSLKMNCVRPWKQQDICKAVELLKLTHEDIPAYFFTPKVQNIEHKEDA